MKNLSRFLVLYKSLWLWSVGGIALAFLTLAANIGLMGVSGWFIAMMGIAGVAGASVNYFTPAAIIRGLSILRTGGRYAERLATHDAALGVTALFRNWFYARLERLPTARIQMMHSGDVWTRLRDDIDTLEKFYLTFIVPACVAMLAVPVLLLSIWWLFSDMAFLYAAALLLAGVVIPILAYRFSSAGHAMLAQEMKRLRIAVTDYVQGMDQIMVYDTSGAIQESMHDAIARIEHIQCRLVLNESVLQALISLVVQGASLVTLMYGLVLLGQGRIEPALLAVLPLLVVVGFDSVLPLANIVPSLLAARQSADRIFLLADEEAALSSYEEIPQADDYELVFDQVNFGYEPDRPVLKQISFSFRSGDQLCIRGPNGSGKTSLIHLMTALWPVTDGQIRLNGRPLQVFDPSAVRALFSVAEQRPYFFTGTIRDNLLRACPTADDNKMMVACDIALLSKDIRQMPGGLDTAIGEGGLKLSGGQIRRLAIARAWLKNAPFILLDEPTEGLELDLAVALVQSLLKESSSRNKAVLLVSHSAAIQKLFKRQIVLPENIS